MPGEGWQSPIIYFNRIALSKITYCGTISCKYVLIAISLSTNCQKLYSERRSNPVTDGKEVCCAKKLFKNHLTCGKFEKGYVNWPSTVYDPPPTPFTLSPSPHPPTPFTLSPYPLHPIPIPPTPFTLPPFTLPLSPYPPSPYPLHPIPLHPTPFIPIPLHPFPFTLPPSPYTPSPYPPSPYPLHLYPPSPYPPLPFPLHPNLSPLPPPTLTSKHSEVPPLIIKKTHNNFAPCKFVIARTFFYGLPCS